MSSIAERLPTLLESEALRCLGGGIDTQKLDDFLDQLFALAERLGSVGGTLVDNQVLRVQSPTIVLMEATISLAKTKMRMLCARLAVRCGEWAGRNVSPYGDEVEFAHPSSKQTCKVRFQNTTGTQEFFLAFRNEPTSVSTF